MSEPQPDLGQRPEGMPKVDSTALASPSLAPLATEDAPTIISKSLRSRNGMDAGYASLLKGRRLAHFELEAPIGVGGMAAVIRARDLQLERHVALKILPPEMAAEPENIRRFQQEARAAARLDHENIARVFYCGEDQGLHFIAFEYVEGDDLRVLMEKRGRIPVAEALHYVLQIATGLAHAAARGVVHRDIKPSNIIVNEHGRAKLVDMGLARHQDGRPDQALTQSGVTLGTFDYISPEQALEPREADVRSDLYSLGCTLYHMLTGKPPVPEGTAARKLQFHQQGAPIDPRQWNPAIPDEVAAILAKLMAKDPNDRYQRPEFLVQHLLAAIQRLSGHAATPAGSGVLFLDSVLPSPPSTRPLVILVGAAAAILLLVGLMGLTPPDDPAPARSFSKGEAKTPGAALPRAPIQLSPRPPPAEEPAAPPAAEQRPINPREADAASVQRLRELLAERTATIINLTLDRSAGVYDLVGNAENDAKERTPGLVFQNAQVLIQAKEHARPILQLTYDLAHPYQQEWAAFTLIDGRLTLRGLRLEIDAKQGLLPLTACLVQGGQLVLEHCEFVQKNPPLPGVDARLSVLRVLRGLTGTARASVQVQNCYFAGGQQAFVLDEGANVEVRDCLFAPYQAPVQLRGKPAHRWETALTIGKSNWLLRPEPVVSLDSQQACAVTLQDCVFSQLESEEAPEGSRSTLIRLGPRQSKDQCRLWSERNYYHNIGTLVAKVTEANQTERLVGELADFGQDAFDDMKDVGSRLSAEPPWAEANPHRALEKLGPHALRLNTSNPFLRPEAALVLGPRRVIGEELYADLARLPLPAAAPTPTNASRSREYVVDRQGPLTTLAAAVGAAEAEESAVITLKVDGVLQVSPIEIGNKKVTIRSSPGFHPVLRLNPKHVPGADGEVALFRVHDGELHLEQLEFWLLPVVQPVKLEALVSLTGIGKCRLQQCVATLAAPEAGVGDGLRLALVALADPTGSMMGTSTKPAPVGTPNIEFADCFIRGRGDLVNVRSSRPFDLVAKNVLVALAGSFLNVEGNKPGAMPPNGASVSLERVTIYLSQHFLQVRTSPALPVQVPVRVDAAATVFVAAEGKPLLALEGPRTEEELKRLLTWRGRKNFYSATGSVLVWQPFESAMGMDLMMPHRYDSARWESLWGPEEEQSRFGRVRFAGVPSIERTWLQAMPEDFKLQPGDLTDADAARGADVEHLPQPTKELPLEQE